MTTLFTSSDCPDCQQAKSWLKRHQVNYEESEPDAACLTEMRLAGDMGLPAMKVGSYWFLKRDLFPSGKLDESKLGKIFMQEVKA